MEPHKPGNFPGSGPEVVQRQRVAKERAAQRVRSWTVQNEMRGVLGRVSTRAAGRILNSANPRDKNLTEGCVRCSEDEIGHSEHDEGAQVPLWKLREHVCQRTSMRRYASSTRGERPQGVAEDASSAPRLASSSGASFPGRNECPGTHCSPIEQKERENSSCQICHRV